MLPLVLRTCRSMSGTDTGRATAKWVAEYNAKHTCPPYQVT